MNKSRFCTVVAAALGGLWFGFDSGVIYGATEAVSPRIILDTLNLEPRRGCAEWQSIYSGWEKEGDAYVRPFGKGWSGCVRYGVGLTLPAGTDAKLEFLDAERSVLRTDEVAGGAERLVSGVFAPERPFAFVRIAPTKPVPVQGLMTRPFRVTREYALDEKFTYLRAGEVPRGWRMESAAVRDLPFQRVSKFPGNIGGAEVPASDPVLAIGPRGSAEPSVAARLLTDRFIVEFDAPFEEGGCLAFGGVELRTLYAFRPDVWYHIRIEAQGTAAAFVARVKVNGREVAARQAFRGLRFQNLAEGIEQLVDDVRILADEQVADYPASPVQPKGGEKYTVGINICSLWYEGEHFGWRCIDQCRGPKPVLGYYDEGLPEVADWEIKYLVEHGVDFQAFCWYPESHDGAIRHPRNARHLVDGYKNARYADRMKYCLIWEIANAGRPHSLASWKRWYVPHLIEHYFKDPRYLTLDGKLVFAVFGAWEFADKTVFGDVATTKAAVDYLDGEVRKLGFKGVLWVASNWNWDATQAAEEGFAATCAYNYGTDGYKLGRNITENLRRAEVSHGLYAIPTVSVGFDSLPWHGQRYPLMTDENLATALRWCRDEYVPDHAKEGTWQTNTYWLSTWNEYGEGTYMMPTEQRGFGYLDAVRSVFTDEMPDAKTHIVPTAAQRERICNLYAEQPVSFARVGRD